MGPVKGAVDMIFGLYSSIDSQVNIICNNPMLGNAKILSVKGRVDHEEKKIICSDQVVSLWRDIPLKIQFCNRADGDI